MSGRYALNKNKYLLDPELEQLHATLKKYKGRDSLLINLALNTGARANELLALTRSDVNRHDQSIFIRGIKNSNDREIPIKKELFIELLEHMLELKGQKLFDISYSRLVQIWDMYRPLPKKFHCLRHTFAINLYKRTRDLRLVQVALGHRNINNTMIYADYLYSQEELRRLIL